MVANMEVELTALGPELTKKSLATEKLMEKLEVDQAEADKVNIFYFFVIFYNGFGFQKQIYLLFRNALHCMIS